MQSLSITDGGCEGLPVASGSTPPNLSSTKSSPSTVHQQRHQSREPDCPRRSRLPDIREITSSVRDPCPQRSVASDSPANRARIIARESHQTRHFHTARVTTRKTHRE